MEPYNKNKTYARHPHAYPKGGFHMSFINEQNTKEIVNSVLKQVGQKLLKGELKDLMGICKPVALTREVSYLEILANDLYYQKYLQIAAKNESNPLLQMQLIVTHILASQHKASTILYTKAPLDSVVGETSHLFKSDYNVHYYAECISSSPPIALYHVKGPNNSYQISGSHKSKVTLSKSLNTLYVETFGNKIIDLGNDNTYECQYPEISIEGIIMGERVMYLYNSFKIENKKNNLVAEIQFGYEFQGAVKQIQNGIGKIGSLIWGSKTDNSQKKRPDDFVVQIYKQQEMEDDGEIIKAVVSEGNGNWLEFIQFDNQIFWKIDDNEQKWQTHEQTLISDSSNRKDKILIAQGLLDQAEKIKIEIEKQDRQDKDLRKQYKKQK